MHFEAVNRGSCPDSFDEIKTRVTEQRHTMPGKSPWNT